MFICIFEYYNEKAPTLNEYTVKKFKTEEKAVKYMFEKIAEVMIQAKSPVLVQGKDIEGFVKNSFTIYTENDFETIKLKVMDY